VTCAEYRELVAADVDGVVGAEAETVRRHLATCEACTRLRERQVAVRNLLRSRSLQQPAPLGLRTRVVAQLEEESQSLHGAPKRWLWARWVGLALLGATAAAVMILWNRDGSFAPLIESYDLASRGALQITFPASEPTELEAYYHKSQEQGFPEHVIDLSSKGFRLVGGVVRDFPKRKARLTVYSDGKNMIVCDYQFAAAFPLALPASGGPIFFSRRGVNFCAKRMDGNEVCVLATRMPMDLFRKLVGGPESG